VKRAKPVYFQKIHASLELAAGNKESARLFWRSAELGCWEEVQPNWRVLGGRIRFQFHDEGGRHSFWISSVRQKPWGMRILLNCPWSPIPEKFDIRWNEAVADSEADFHELWNIVRQWLRQKFPGHQVLQARKKTDRSKTLSASFIRIFFCHQAAEYLLLAADESAEDVIHFAFSQAVLWLSCLRAGRRFKGVPIIYLLVPSGHSAVLCHRSRFLNPQRIHMEVLEYEKRELQDCIIRQAPAPAIPEENRDYHWPVLGPFRWSTQLERVLDLAPGSIRRYPRFQDYDSLRLQGLEFGQVTGAERNRICFGAGTPRIELTEDNFDCLRSLVEEILYYRRPDSPDTQHPYYRLQAERWLEALILEDVPRLFPEMAVESVYSQIPVYLENEPGRIDILGADLRGTLVVMELKTAANPDLPMQALDYWGRVIRHNENGDFERRGYFSEIRLNRDRPKIYLISPIFSFHDSTERLLRFLDPSLEVWKIAINEDWRSGVRILRRTCYRCGELE
jgi:hypothetical protein